MQGTMISICWYIIPILKEFINECFTENSHYILNQAIIKGFILKKLGIQNPSKLSKVYHQSVE